MRIILGILCHHFKYNQSNSNEKGQKENNIDNILHRKTNPTKSK
jgi:hypothetical protein